jgi:hypothetical protein
MSHSVTANGSTPNPEPLGVTECKGCEKHDRDLEEERRHCRSCHANDHYECFQCGACLPPRPQRQYWRPDGGTPGVRRDRRYCSERCRQRAWVVRHAPEAVAARAAWEASPKGQEHRAMMEALAEAFRGRRPDPRIQEQRARWAAEICAECGDPITGTVWLRANLVGRLVATCERCRCRYRNRDTTATITCQACETENRVPRDKIEAGLTPRCGKCKAPLNVEGSRHNKFCAECRPTERSWNWETEWTCPLPRHTPEYCWRCHPWGWHAEKPCAGCGRRVRREVTRQTRHWSDWRPMFCSVRCRTREVKDRARIRRVEQRLAGGAPRCATCAEILDGQRPDARYCAARCRQRAYRARLRQPVGTLPRARARS